MCNIKVFVGPWYTTARIFSDRLSQMNFVLQTLDEFIAPEMLSNVGVSHYRRRHLLILIERSLRPLSWRLIIQACQAFILIVSLLKLLKSSWTAKNVGNSLWKLLIFYILLFKDFKVSSPDKVFSKVITSSS